MKPDEMRELADRIDVDAPYGFESEKSLTVEQKDRRDAAVSLRRYASGLALAEGKRKEGEQYMRGYRFDRCDMSTYRRGCGDHAWHVAINKFSESLHAQHQPWPRMMYTAKMVSDEVPRMILLFEQERKGLAKTFKMCAHDPSPAVPLPDNHLRCALGKECRECPYLQAIESFSELSNEAKDEAKAWTCATHILLESDADAYFESFLADKGDDEFHRRMCQPMGVVGGGL